MEQLIESWVASESAEPLKIVEDYLQEGIKSEVDGKIILGKVVGPSFFGDGVSRNQRFYPRAVWENVLSNPQLQTRLKDRMVLGCVGHSDGPVTERDVSSGNVSHIVTKMYLQEDNQGICELLILNTPAGRNLYTLMKAGSRIRISSRAQGKFLEGQTHDGLPIVDPKSFVFETFDLVLNPGFIETDPRLQESLRSITEAVQKLESSKSDKTSSTNSIKEKFTMDEKLFEELRRNNSQFESLYKEEKRLREEAEKEAEEAEKEAEEAKDELRAVKEELELYHQLGEAQEIYNDMLEYQELGFSNPTEARFILESLNEAAEDAIKDEEVEELKKDIEEAAERLAQYEALGTPEELKMIKDRAEELVDELEKKDVDEAISYLSKKYNLKESVVAKIVAFSESEEEAEETCKEVCKEKEDDEDPKDDFRGFSYSRFSAKDRLEGMADPVGGDDTLKDYENDHQMPNSVNDNDVEATPDVVEEALQEMLQSSKGKGSSNMLEGYRPGTIVNNMFS